MSSYEKLLEKVESFNEALQVVANLIASKERILVLSGAGLSVSCGIPDFRSKGTGLYNTLKAAELGLSSAEDLFEIESFLENPQPFFTFAKQLYPGTIQPSPSHYFMFLLEQKKKLLRIYTQNIDGLETKAGIQSNRIVHAHGSLLWAKCVSCGKIYNGELMKEPIMNGTIPFCEEETKKIQTLVESTSRHPPCRTTDNSKRKKQKETTNTSVGDSIVERPKRKKYKPSKLRNAALDLREDGPLQQQVPIRNDEVPSDRNSCGGIIKPSITFFGEKLDDTVGKALKCDRMKADALIVIGTSLSVAPMSKVLHYLPSTIPRILINKKKIQVSSDGSQKKRSGRPNNQQQNWFDVCLLGECDEVICRLAKELGWEKDLKRIVKNGASRYSSSNNLPSKVLRNCADGEVIGNALVFPSVSDDYELESTKEQNDDDDHIDNVLVVCDECDERIKGSIMRCVVCFDYDLCLGCYPKASKKHFKGKHSFELEK